MLARLRAERARRASRHELLVSVLRRLLRPRIGGIVVATTLRRLLRMAGLDPTVNELAAATLAVGGRYGRAGARGAAILTGAARSSTSSCSPTRSSRSRPSWTGDGRSSCGQRA
jgi:hypothetical protein